MSAPLIAGGAVRASFTRSMVALPDGSGVAQAMLQGNTQAAMRRGASELAAATRMSGTAAALALPTGDGAFQQAAGQMIGQAIGQFQEAYKASEFLSAQADFTRQAAALQTEFKNDQDYATAPQRFAERYAELQRDTVVRGLDWEQRGRLQLATTRAGVSMLGDIENAALQKRNDRFMGDLETLEAAQLNRAAGARSDAERQAAWQEYETSLQAGMNGGWLSAQQAAQRRQRFGARLDDALVLRGINSDPQAAAAALRDPKNFQYMDPATRETRIGMADAKHDDDAIAGLRQHARFDPVGATLSVGRITSLDQIAAVVDRGLIRQESGGNPNAQSPKGAAGLTQFMPDTARAVARQMGVKALEGLDDAGVRAALKADPALARNMAIFHLGDLAKKFDGSLPAALAAYHAGIGSDAEPRAMAWHRAAVAKYGEGYTAAEFVTMIPQSMHDGRAGRRGTWTGDYVLSIYRHVGADPTAGGLSGRGVLRAAEMVAGEARQMSAQQLKATRDLVSVTQADRDAVLESFRKGYMVDPEQIQRVRAPLQAAASRGDVEAGNKLIRFDTLQKLSPVVAEAWRLPTEQVEAERMRLETEAARNGLNADGRTRLEVFQKVSEEIATARKTSPRDLLGRQYSVPAVDIAIPRQPGEMPAFGASLAQASAQAEQAQRLYGGALIITRPHEREALTAAWQGMGTEQRVAFLGAVGQNLPENQRAAFMGEIAKTDTLAVTAARFAGRPGGDDLARDILRGQDLLKQKGGNDPKAGDVTEALRGTLGGAMFGEATGGVVEAAKAIYAAERAATGKLFDPSDSRAMQAAIERITGPIVSFNGRKTPVPPTIGAARFERGFSLMDQADLDLAGGAVDRNGRAFDPAFLRGHAQLLPLEPQGTRYAVVLPQGGVDLPVLSKDGRPLVLDMGRIVDAIPRKETAMRAKQAERVGPQEADLQAGIRARRRDALNRTGFDPERPR